MGDIGKEWTRIVQTVQGFGKKHGHWPTRLVLPESTFDALKDTFPPDDWAFLSKEIQIRTGAERPRAEDDEGDSYIWGESLATRLTFKVDVAEPTWFSLEPLAGSSDDAPDALTRALVRLGYTAKYSDAGAAIERAVARAGSAAVRALSDENPDGPPGSVSGELLALLRVRKVRDVMSARAFRRIQRAVLRVYAAEFVAYFAAADDEGSVEQPKAWAHELSSALKDKPLSDARLQALAEQVGADPGSTGHVGVVSDLAELVEWASAIALDERQLAESDAEEAPEPEVSEESAEPAGQPADPSPPSDEDEGAGPSDGDPIPAAEPESPLAATDTRGPENSEES